MLIVWIGAVSALWTGCAFNWMKQSRWFSSPEPCVLTPHMSAQELVTHLNRNIAMLYSWRSTDVRIQARGPGGLPIKLNAVLAVESPRNFRLIASSLGGNEADLGSNSERFWFWMRRNEPKAIITARHEQMHVAQQRLQLPFQPDWLMEALGVVLLDENEFTLHRTGTDNARISLVADQLSPTGRPVKRVIVVDGCYGNILEQSLYDESNRLIAKAVLGNHRRDPVTGVTMAHRIELNWPQAELALTMNIGHIDVNLDGIPEQTWELPTIAGYPVVDIGAQTPLFQGGPRPRTGYATPAGR